MKSYFYTIRKNGAAWSTLPQEFFNAKDWKEAVHQAYTLSFLHQAEIRLSESIGYDNQGHNFNQLNYLSYSDLTRIEVTQGNNDYPKSIYNAYIGDSLPILKRIQEKEGGRLVFLKKRDGWHFYNNNGDFFYDSLIKVPLNDSDFTLSSDGKNPNQDAWDYVFNNSESITKWLADVFPDVDDFDVLEEIIEKKKEFIEEIVTEIELNENSLIFFDNNNEHVIYGVNEKSTSFYEDVWTYQLALIPENDIE